MGANKLVTVLVAFLIALATFISTSTGSQSTTNNGVQNSPSTAVPAEQDPFGFLDLPFADTTPTEPDPKPAPPPDTPKSSNGPPQSCHFNTCELMNGICNNGTCKPQQDCQSDITCDCLPGFEGAFCDVVTTGSTTTSAPTSATVTDSTATGRPGDSTGIPNGGAAGNDSTTHKNVVDTIQSPAEKYKQPKGTFVKGPEVPTPQKSKPIKVNVKSQPVKGKSTTIIRNFTDTVTIATVSVKLEQSMSVDLSGKTVVKKLKKTSPQDKQTTKPMTAKTGNKNQSKVTAKTKKSGGAKSKSDVQKDKAKSAAGDFKNAKNVHKVALSSGTVLILDQSVKKTSSTTRDRGSSVKTTSTLSPSKP